MQRNYRGQRVDTNEWVYGYFVKAWDETCYIITEFGSCVTACDECGANDITAFEVIPETVGESTGLKDKNGKEIYIGDIVNCLEVSNYRTSEYISEVYEEECEVLVHDSITSDTPLAIFFPHKEQVPLTEIEVIGNIYDNPELLQEVDK